MNGMDVKSYSDDDLRQRIGFVLQKAALFKGTVRDNLKWGNENATDDEMLVALEKHRCWILYLIRAVWMLRLNRTAQIFPAVEAKTFCCKSFGQKSRIYLFLTTAPPLLTMQRKLL